MQVESPATQATERRLFERIARGLRQVSGAPGRVTLPASVRWPGRSTVA